MYQVGFFAEMQNLKTGQQGLGFGESTKRWHELGASVIGGCCKTTPEDIRALAAWARK